MKRENILRGKKVGLSAVKEADVATVSEWYQDTAFLRLYDSKPAYPQTEKQITERLREGQENRDTYLHRVCLTVFSYNQAAIALYESLGFQHEGTYREHLMRDGQRHDMLLFGLLRREWQDSAEDRT